MRIAICIAAVVALAAGGSSAKDAAGAETAAGDAVQSSVSQQRVLYICDADAITRRGFAREFGSAQFVTAQEAVAKGEPWAQPKCITPLEARRLRAKRLASVR